ncbi:MAG: class I SAM-dependent methyltransferase, partial [Nitrosopumilaceae archaeon]|nr:class I SAM-dependent methyltransferase [Nitrosopumilaceae archaeon]
QLAEKSNLNERYVREWLGAMVTGKIVDYEPSNKTYSLSEEKAKLLSRDGSYNFASSMQWIPALAYVEDEIVKCFEKGGGVPYESYHRFHAVMAEESSQTVLPALVHSILPLVPGLVEDLKGGIRVLDVGCGSGRALNLMAKNFPNSQFTGYDFSKEAIDYATSESEKLGNKNTSFQIQDVEHFPASEKFDLVTAFDAIHDQAAPAKVLQNIRGAVKEQGIFLMQDIGSSSQLENNKTHPLGPFLYTVSCLHCMTVSLALNGHGLGAMWGKEKATEMLNEAGFSKVDVKQLPHDPINYYYIAK